MSDAPSPEVPRTYSGDAVDTDAESLLPSRTASDDSNARASSADAFVPVPLAVDDRATPPMRYRAADALDAMGFGTFQVMILAFVGLAWTADAMEMMLLSFLGPAMRCEFGVGKTAEGLLTSVVFAGMMIGAPSWGAMSDQRGRRPALLGSATATLAGGVGSALAGSFGAMLFFRFCVGVGLGGVPVAYGLFIEFLPSGNRGMNLCLIELFWTLGSAIESGLAWIVLPHGSWRLLLLLSTTPLFAFIVCIIIVPESVMYSVSAGRMDEAKETLRRVSKANGKPLPPGELVASHAGDAPELEDRTVFLGSESRTKKFLRKHVPTSFRALLSKTHAKTSLLVWLIFFGCAFLYYGVVLLTTTLNVRENASASLKCLQNNSPYLTSGEYADIFFSSLAEVPGVLIAVAVIDRIGRRGSMALTLAATAVFTFPIAFKSIGVGIRDVALFCSRSAAFASFTILYVFTGEIYPTRIRSSGLGVGNSFARIGGIACPLFAVTLVETGHRVLAVTFFLVVAVVAVAATLSLDIETTGRKLDADDEPGVELAPVT